ncbi:hypothetical protein ACFLRW_03065 [Acidobacteriota bacterium]
MKNTANQPLTQKTIFIFWLPLAATWLMMATEGPFLAAIIARLNAPKINLAAYGVAFSIALLVEAPIIMLMSGATALVKDRHSYLKFRNFSYSLNGIISLLMLLVLLPPVFSLITKNLMKLPEDVAHLTYLATAIMLPWPAAIGFRRFYQGILIRSHLTRRVAYGTVLRLAAMATTGLVSYVFFKPHGAVVGAMSLSVGVTVEALVSRIMVNSSIKALCKQESKPQGSERLSYKNIITFYYPLALTSILNLGVFPMVTFFMGQSRMALESLAVLPVIHSMVFILRSLGLSFQEVGIALLGEKQKNYKPLRNFAILLGLIVLILFSIVSFTPLAFIWFNSVSGLSLELSQFALLPTKILTLTPSLMVLLTFLRAIMVNNRKTKQITIATTLELSTVIILLVLTTQVFGMIGAIGAAVSMAIARMMANGYLLFPSIKVLKAREPSSQ